MYHVGFARVDITPTESVPLAGYGNTSQRMSDSVRDPLYSSCTALTDENGATVLLFHNDLCTSSAPITEPVKAAVSEATGIGEDHICVCATHTHSGPDVWNREFASIPNFLEALPKLLSQCALEALADRKPAVAYSAKVHTDRLNFVRHYILEDGHYKGANFGDQYNSPIACHTTQVDEEMRLVKFVREGGKDVILVNWQIHPNRVPVDGSISADVVGEFRLAMENALDCHFAFFNGGAGNIAPHSAIRSENRTATVKEHGEKLAEHAMSARYEPLALGPISVVTKTYQEPLNRPDPKQLEAARKVVDFWQKTNDPASSRALAVENGFSSQYAAISAIQRSKEKSDIVSIAMTAVTVGEFAFITVPHEMFDTNAKYVRDFSPCEITFISSLSNGALPYIPSAYAYIYDCYEAATSKCKPGTGERVVDVLVKMLRQTKER